MCTLTYATPTFIAEVHHFVTQVYIYIYIYISAFNDSYIESTPYTVLAAYSYWVSKVGSYLEVIA